MGAALVMGLLHLGLPLVSDCSRPSIVALESVPLKASTSCTVLARKLLRQNAQVWKMPVSLDD